MKKTTLTMLLGAALLTSAGSPATAAPKHQLKGMPSDSFSRARKAKPAQKWSAPLNAGQKPQRVSPYFTSDPSDLFQYLYAPDGSQWYALCHYDADYIEHEAYTEQFIKGFTYTIYDNNFNEIGKVSDKIEFLGNETKCAQVMLDVTVTKSFFNTDSKYEVMVSFCMNTPEYVTNVRTKAYSIEPEAGEATSTPLTVIPGYPIDAVNCAKDRWSEDFYITFLTEEEGNDPDDYESYIDFLGSFHQVLTTYGKGNTTVMERKIRMLDLPGDQMNSPGLLCKNVDGKLTLIYAQYEKSFFENPAGMSENESLNPDNRLVIDVYQMKDSYTKEMELINTTKIEALQKEDDPSVYCTYYGIGTLMWDKDIDFGTYVSDGTPAFVVTADDYLFSDDDHYRSSYYVYDAAGNRIKTIAEDTYDYVMLSDLPGYEPQAMFINIDEMTYEFIDLYSGKSVTKLDQNFRGYPLSTSMDRVATADGYAYAFALSTGIATDDTHLAAPVCWIDKNGELIRVDLIPTGEGIELAQIYMNGEALNPYLFNTDNDLEYVLLVKRRVAENSPLREELLISSPKKGVIHTFTAEEGKGALRTVYVIADANPELIIAYMDDDYKFTTDAYSLPFSQFAGGSGTVADPYLIATAGDLQQIKVAPGANFKLTADLDCGSLNYYTIDEFSGTLDGAGHTVANLRLTTQKNEKTGLFNYCTGATVKDIDFYNATMVLSGAYEAGLIAATASNSTFDDIHVRRFTATGDSYSGEFGGIVGKMWTKSAITACEVAGADINLPSCPSAGGMTGDIRTGCTITSCAFSGNMTANNTLGGIVGSTTTGDEVISFCHVDANLKAENTVGGIVGFLDRSKVKSNYVEGTIEATKPSKWNNSVSLGGIAGELEGDWQGKADVPVVNNLIGISALIAPDMTGIEEQYPRQLATVHRVVGKSSYNSYFEEEPSKIIYENGVYNNYVVSDIAVIDQEFNERSIEGTTTDKDEMTEEMLIKMGFIFGNTSYGPWNVQAWYAYDPSLYYESIAYIPTQEINVDKGETFEVEIAILSRETLTEEDIVDGFMCEYDENLLEMTGNMSYDGKTLKLELTAISEGSTPLTVSVLGNNAACKVNVNGGNAVEGIVAAGNLPIIEDGVIIANGCAIVVYDLNGKALLSGRDVIDVNALASGIYVATATDTEGTTRALKFAR